MSFLTKVLRAGEGKKLVALSIGGAVLLTMLRGMFAWFGGF